MWEIKGIVIINMKETLIHIYKNGNDVYTDASYTIYFDIKPQLKSFILQSGTAFT